MALEQDLPAGTLVRHLCHNKLCLNPVHLALGTDKQNADDEADKLHSEPRFQLLVSLSEAGINFAEACRKAGVSNSKSTRRWLREACN